MTFECGSAVLHKKDTDACDSNNTDAFELRPASSLHARRVVPREETEFHLHLHSHYHHHHQHRRCWLCSATTLLYVTVFSLLVLWIGLQLSMAQIYLDDYDNDTSLRTDTFLRTRNMNDANKNYGVRISYRDSFTKSVDQIAWGAYFLLSILHRPSSSEVTNNVTTSHSQLIEEEYALIFYLLLGINFLTMLPALCKHLFSGPKKNRVHPVRSTEITAQQQEQPPTNEEGAHQAPTHRKLLQVYLPAYLFATCADWLQGPYKYALYSSYGYTQRDIAHLFVAGYGSGMVLGSIVGGLADSYGRKRLCLFYCLSYTFSVLMKHCKNFYVLLLGRVGGGVATSLLFSVFESWLICAHGERGLLGRSRKGGGGSENGEEEEKWLAKSLSVSMYGSSLVAIGSGILANLVVENSGKMRPWDGDDESSFYVGGYIAAFDMCLVPLALCAALIAVLWEENFGEAAVKAGSENQNGQYSAGFLKKHSSVQLYDDTPTKEDRNGSMDKNAKRETPSKGTEIYQRNEGMFSALLGGMHTVWNSPNILICCIIGSIFEGAMYIFIFLWTPALTSLQDKLDHSHVDPNHEAGIVESTKDLHTDSELPFGWIFSTFMVCCMLGTIAFSRLSDAGVPASKCLAGILALASVSCLAMACPYSGGASIGIGSTTTSASTPQYIGMLVYEFCIGFYYPAMGTVKGTIVPEDQRAAIYNVFRLPLNLVVLVYLVGDFSTEISFSANAMLLLVACMLQIKIVGSSSGCDIDNVDSIGKT